MPGCPSCGTEAPEGARFCPACGHALAAGPAPRVLRKVVTVLFCDLVDSTRMGEGLDPETLRQVVASYFRVVSEVLDRHGGAIEKFIGDAVMAVFGVPAVREDDALRAVRAATEMRAALGGLNEQLERRYGVRLQTRTGVNTGEVIAGDPSRGQAFVSGDAVNVAARLEQAAGPGEILIGERTFELVRRSADAEAVPPLELKGKSRPVRAFRLLDVAPAAEEGLSAPLIGRDAELARLRDAFRSAVGERRCERVTVLGPAGIGKSRLVAELAASVGEEATVLTGRCLSYGEGLTYWPLREIVAGIAGTEDPAAARSALEALLAGDEDAPTVLERLAGTLGWTEAAASPHETSWAVRRLLGAAAAQRPLVVVVEDLHWAEPVFADLVEHVAGTLTGAPVLVVVLARDELRDVHPGFGAGTPVLELAPLGSDDSRRLVQHLLDDEGVAADLADLVFARAEGNPLFVEELVRMLVDERLLTPSEGGLSAMGPSPLSLPPTIHALIAARVDRLDPDEAELLDAAAVVGASFGRVALAALVDDAGAALGARLEALERRQLVAPDGGSFAGDPTFSFTHALVRDVVYEGLLKARRADLHTRYADWLEQAAGDRAAEYDELLGYHLERAHRSLAELGPVDDDGRALGARAGRRLGASGARALARGDAGPAVTLLEQAVALVPADDPGRRELTVKLGIALAETGQLTRVDAMLRDRVGGRQGGPFVVFHDRTGTQHVVGLEAPVTVGRRPDNDVALTWDEEVSRRHARIEPWGGGWMLVDTDSRNGSYRNGERIPERSPLRDGDVLRFGDTAVWFRVPGGAGTPTVVPPGGGQMTVEPPRGGGEG